MRRDDEADMWRWWEEQHAPNVDDLYQTYDGNGCAAIILMMAIWTIILIGIAAVVAWT